MAGTQQNQLKNSLFPPSLFDDPDAISQIAQVEAPQTPQMTPGDQANVPLGGAVPKTFLDWHADPVNVAKVPQPIPPNTPMPSVVAAKVQSAIQPSSDGTPPFSPDVSGSPEAQLYGSPTPQAAPTSTTQGPGLMKNVPAPASLEDALTGGAPAVRQPATPPQQLTPESILAAYPGGHAPVANAPYVPQGKKLALTGLFAALDSVGASLDHGQATVAPGLMRQVEALREYNQNLPVAQRNADNAVIDQRLKQAQDVAGIQKTSIENQNLQLFGPPQQRKAQFIAQLQQEAEAGKIPPDELRRRALTTAQYNGMNVAPEEIDSVIQNTKPIGPKFTVKTGEKGVFEGLTDRQGNFYPPNQLPNDPDAQALAKSATGIHSQLVNEEVDKESRVAGIAADRQGKQIAAAIQAANIGEENKTVNAGREQALKHLNDMRAAQNQLGLVQDLASSKSPTDQTSLAFKALGLDLPDGVHRINETELNAIKNQGSLPDRAYRAVLNWTTGQQFAPEILQDISATATKIANSKIKNSNDNLRDVKRVYGYQVAGSGPGGGLDEAPAPTQGVQGRLSRSAAQNSPSSATPPPGASDEVYAADNKTLIGHIVNGKYVALGK
jgi:hypothetical protein